MKHTKLTKKERELLSHWKKEGVSNKECARRLSRHVSTIGRELKRNKTRVTVGNNDWQMIYEPAHAHHIAETRKQNAWFAKQPLKSRKIYSYVLEKLKDSWSPEQIAGRLREVDHPDDPSWHICHETIYQFIYKKKSEYTKRGLMQQSVLVGERKNSGDGNRCRAPVMGIFEAETDQETKTGWKKSTTSTDTGSGQYSRPTKTN